MSITRSNGTAAGRRREALAVSTTISRALHDSLQPILRRSAASYYEGGQAAYEAHFREHWLDEHKPRLAKRELRAGDWHRVQSECQHIRSLVDTLEQLAHEAAVAALGDVARSIEARRVTEASEQ